MKEMSSGVDRGDSNGAMKAIVHGDWLDVKDKGESEDSKMFKGLNLREQDGK